MAKKEKKKKKKVKITSQESPAVNTLHPQIQKISTICYIILYYKYYIKVPNNIPQIKNIRHSDQSSLITRQH